MGRGRPEINEYKKDYWTDRVKPKLELIEGWARNGLSNPEIATNLGIGTSTLGKFLREHEELADTIQRGREYAQIIVENALFKRACGFSYVESTKERKRDEESGELKMIVTKKVSKYVVPDTNAAIYWLEHRAPNRWEKNPSPGLDTDKINEHVESLAELLMKPVPERKIGSELDD